MNILEAGSGWLVIDKPSGMSVHNDPGNDVLSKVKDLLLNDSSLAQKCARQTEFDPAPVHRLDRETSGALLLATAPKTATILARSFQEPSRAATKEYVAVLYGGGLGSHGVWLDALSDRAEGRVNPAGPSELRKPCETRFRTIEENRHLTRVMVELRTGRQHQIRKHAALAGHAIVGDRRYGEPKSAERITRLFFFDRLFLHAYRLELKGEIPLCAEAPVPEEFRHVFLPPRQE